MPDKLQALSLDDHYERVARKLRSMIANSRQVRRRARIREYLDRLHADRQRYHNGEIDGRSYQWTIEQARCNNNISMKSLYGSKRGGTDGKV